MTKKYKIIVKLNAEKFAKYHSENLLSFVKFLDSKFPEWRYFNVFDDKGVQVGNFTKNNRPEKKNL